MYDTTDGCSEANVALLAWVGAMCMLGDYYAEQFVESGNQQVIPLLSLEEANLLHAQRIARSQGCWHWVTSTMQSLVVLYNFRGRLPEFSLLVEEVVPDCCTDEDRPIAERYYMLYSSIMGYRVEIARLNRDFTRAAYLQNRRLEWDRLQAAPVLALTEGEPIDHVQRNQIKALSHSVFLLGHILSEQKNSACLAAFEESIGYDRRIGDIASEATTLLYLGHAYKNIPAIRDLDKAESTYQRGLALHDTEDEIGRLVL